MHVIEGEAQIEFPCRWEYKVIAEQKEHIEMSVFDVVDRSYELFESKKSQKGKYISMTLAVEVESKEEMTDIFHRLKKSDKIKFVL